jgi:hypothetical protein
MTSLYQHNQALPSQYREGRTGMSTRDVVEIGTSLLGGLGIGAALMYLFDPEVGPDRRTYLADATAETLGGTKGYFGQTLETLGSAASSLSDRFGHAADDASEGASSMWDSTRKSLRRGMKGARKSMHRTSADWSDYLPSMPSLPRVSSRSSSSDELSTLLVTAAGCVAAGALLMYIFDPQSGRRRRAMARDKTYSAAKQTSRYAQKTARHYGNVTTGMMAQGRSMAQQGMEKAREGVQKATEAATSMAGGGRPSNGPQTESANPT